MLGTTRRSFLTALASVTGIGALEALSAPAADAQQPAPRGDWDLSWLDSLKGRHKQVFAVGALKGHQPLHVVTNYLDAHQEVFGLAYPDVNAVVGIAVSLPVNVGDALWDKYELGRRWEVKDPQTGEWARRNVYTEKMPAGPGKAVGVRELQARGAIFWQCNNALTAVASQLARDLKLSVADVRADLVAGFNPGVKLIPAHTMLLGLCQERGCTYEHVG